ncbi:hypothetical protein G952_03883 [Escherichia coli UMEA 3240-1]|nr:hypothetical protein G952_03883 [Escherichia coli UMEA 3240-1]
MESACRLSTNVIRLSKSISKHSLRSFLHCAECVFLAPSDSAKFIAFLCKKNRRATHLFAVLDHEVANSRQFGEFVSLDAPVEADAQDVAEAMVEEEVFEFYQPDDTLRLADIIADSQHPDAATIAEEQELVDRSSEFAFAFDLLKDMPRLWRRIFLLIRVDGLDASSVSEILLIPSKEDTLQRWLMQAEAFIAAHLEEAGVSKNGNDWLQGVDWSALSVTRSEATSPQSKQANHEK